MDSLHGKLCLGFTALNFCIALTNLLYVPILAGLRNVYNYEQFEPEHIGMTEQSNGFAAKAPNKTVLGSSLAPKEQTQLQSYESYEAAGRGYDSMRPMANSKFNPFSAESAPCPAGNPYQ